MPQVEEGKENEGRRTWLPKVVAAVIPLAVVAVVAGAYFGWRYLAGRESREYAQVSERAGKLNELKQYTQAIALLEKYVQGKHTVEHTYQITIGLAYDYALTGDNQKGFDTMRHAEEIMPKGVTSVFLHSSLASGYAQRGDKATAIKEYQLAIADAQKDQNYVTTPYVSQFQQRISELEQKP